MKRIVVTGSNGQVGQELQRSISVAEVDFFFFDREQLDILSPQKIEKVLKEHKPHFLINLAAYTNVEKAELEEDLAYQVNVIGAKNLSKACKKNGVFLIHFSTDYVFGNGNKDFYVEEDLTFPLNTYGKTKLQGEREIILSGCKYLILRTSWVYGNLANNFYLKMLQLSQKSSEINVVEDQWGSPTSTKEICRAIDSILKKSPEDIPDGIFHFSGSGKTNWKEFAIEIFKQSKIPVIVKGVKSEYYENKALRPQNSYLSSLKFTEEFEYIPMHWKNALTEIIQEKKISPIKVGYLTTIAGVKYVVASVDWAKKECTIAEINNMQKFLKLNFEDLNDNES
jgi:dTDP-4-dehydrorhamnose reductase